jgi:hypothetical protein
LNRLKFIVDMLDEYLLNMYERAFSPPSSRRWRSVRKEAPRYPTLTETAI